jgi:hypothetical protein
MMKNGPAVRAVLMKIGGARTSWRTAPSPARGEVTRS